MLRTMKVCILIASLVLVEFSDVMAQSNPLDKKMEKAYNLAEKGKLEEADDYVTKLLNENPRYGTGWDYLCKIRYQLYQNSKSIDGLFSGSVTVTSKDENGNEVKVEDDTLAAQFMSLVNNLKPGKLAYSKYQYTLRKATLLSPDCLYASRMLRALFVDPPVDTAVSKKALKYYNEAEQEFANKNYSSAAKLYRRALAGQDLTEELADAPHAEQVFEGWKVVGKLV